MSFPALRDAYRAHFGVRCVVDALTVLGFMVAIAVAHSAVSLQALELIIRL